MILPVPSSSTEGGRSPLGGARQHPGGPYRPGPGDRASRDPFHIAVLHLLPQGSGGGNGCRSAAQEVAVGMGIRSGRFRRARSTSRSSSAHGTAGIGDEPVHRLPDLHPAKSEGVHGGDRCLLPGHREVVGQRPMSQRDDALRGIEKHSGCAGIVLRPLSARHLPPSLPEREGWVDREISWRSRGAPARSRSGSRRSTGSATILALRGMHADRSDLLPQGAGSPRPSPFLRMHEVLLLKAGRHFRVRGMKAIVAKNEEENAGSRPSAGERTPSTSRTATRVHP